MFSTVDGFYIMLITELSLFQGFDLKTLHQLLARGQFFRLFKLRLESFCFVILMQIS